MPLDTSIYNLIRPQQPIQQGPMPFETAGQMMQIKHLMGQNELQGLQRGELERGIREQGQIRDLFSRGNVKPEEVYAINPTIGAQYQKSAADQQAAQAKLLEQDDKLIKSFAERSKEELLAVTPEQWPAYRKLQLDRASMLSTPQFKQVAQQALAQMPEQYDPNWVRATLSGATPAPAGHTRMPGGGLSPVDPNYQAGRVAVSRAGAPQITVSTEKKYGEALAGQIAQQDAAMLEAARKAPDLASRANQVLETVSSGKVITGAGADIRLQIGKALNLAGASDAEVIANTELLATDMARNTLDAIKASGLGAGNGFSNADRDFLEKAVGGKITLEGATIKKLAELSHRAAEQMAKKWGTRVKQIPADVLRGTGLPADAPQVPALFKAPTAPAAPQVPGVKGVLTPNPDGSFNYGRPR